MWALKTAVKKNETLNDLDFDEFLFYLYFSKSVIYLSNSMTNTMDKSQTIQQETYFYNNNEKK